MKANFALTLDVVRLAAESVNRRYKLTIPINVTGRDGDVDAEHIAVQVVMALIGKLADAGEDGLVKIYD